MAMERHSWRLENPLATVLAKWVENQRRSSMLLMRHINAADSVIQIKKVAACTEPCTSLRSVFRCEVRIGKH
jgi:hypothetical protein